MQTKRMLSSAGELVLVSVVFGRLVHHRNQRSLSCATVPLVDLLRGSDRSRTTQLLALTSPVATASAVGTTQKSAPI